MPRSWKVAQDSSDVIWQDPSSYNPLTQGPEYLPKTASASPASVLTAAGFMQPTAALPSLLVLLRALAMVHQTHHWCTHGDSYYGDHLLFERLYNGVSEEIDGIGERAVGMGGMQFIRNLNAQAAGVQRVVGLLSNLVESPNAYVESSLEAEQLFASCTTVIVAKMKETGLLTRGVDNLIAGVEDKHESHRYLLQQRLWKSV